MNVNLFPMLPRDITKVILEQTGGLEHVDKIKVLKEGIYFKSVCNYLDSLPIYEWFEHITFEESIEYMNMFTRCNCCNRHKKNVQPHKCSWKDVLWNNVQKKIRVKKNVIVNAGIYQELCVKNGTMLKMSFICGYIIRVNITCNIMFSKTNKKCKKLM